MELFVEVIARNGRVKDRVRLVDSMASVGRSYSNKIILSDPYVSPLHLSLRYNPEAQSWNVTDDGSQNGSVLVGQGRVLKETQLKTGDIIEIGHTRLRFVYPNHPIPSTRLLPPGRFTLDYLSSPWVALILLAMIMMTFALDWYIGQGVEIKWQEVMLEGLIYVAFPVTWGCVWSLIGRIMMHDARFALHLSLGCILVFVSQVLAVAADYLAFGLNNSFGDWLVLIGEALITVGVLLISLWVSTHLSRRRRWFIANAIAWGIAGFVQLYNVAKLDEYDRAQAEYLMKPPFAQFQQSVSVDDFMGQIDLVLEQLLDAEKKPQE